MSVLLRQLRLTKLSRSAAEPGQAGYSSVSDFVKNVKSAVESNPDLKKSVEQLKKSAESISERTKAAAEDLKKSAEQATEQVKGAASQFTEAAGGSFRGETSESGKPGSRADDGRKASTSGAESAESSSGSSSAGSSGPQQVPTSLSTRLRSAFAAVRKEVEEAVLPKTEQVSATRARDPSIRPAGNPSASAVSVVKQESSGWKKQWAEMQEKLGLHPIFHRLRGLSDNKVFNRGREVAEDLRERWETSDSALVQRIQDMRDSMFSETEQAQALREIRSRSPDFDMVRFVRVLKGDVPVVIKAYLQGDLAALREHCSPEMLERFSGIIAAQKAEGVVTDSTILDVSDVELVDLKFVEGSPVVVVQFTCQQINCARDKFGNVVDGGPQDVQRVYYYWALQQDDAGFVGEDGKFHPPRWQLREMMVRGMHNLL